MATPFAMHAPLLGEILVAKCKVAPEAIERALQKQREEGGLLGEVLVRLKLCDEEQLALALAVQFDLEYVRDLPRADDIPVDLIDKIPINFARQREVMPFRRENGRVVIAVADPHAVEVIDAVAVLLGEPVEPGVVATQRIIDHIIKTYSRLRGGAELEESHKKQEDTEDSEYAIDELVDMLDANDEAPIIRWVNSLMFQAA